MLKEIEKSGLIDIPKKGDDKFDRAKLAKYLLENVDKPTVEDMDSWQDQLKTTRKLRLPSSSEEEPEEEEKEPKVV